MSVPAEPLPDRFKHLWWARVLACRPAFLIVTVVGGGIGLSSAHAQGVPLDLFWALVCVALSLLAHAAANLINDYHDAQSGADAENPAHERLYPYTGGSRFIQNRVLTPAQVARTGYGLLGLVILGGLVTAFFRGWGLLGIGLMGLFLAWAYSAPPVALMRRGLGEIGILSSWLLVVVGFDFVQRGHVALLPFVAGFPFALLVVNILFINQFPDAPADARNGKKTVVVVLGPLKARWLYFAFSLIAYAWIFLMVERALLPHKTALAAMTLVFSFRAAQILREEAGTPSGLRTAIALTILAACLHGLVLAGTLAWLGPAHFGISSS
jgi:1,4-dihydroxy-2-naphthoate polyprenyltransferase